MTLTLDLNIDFAGEYQIYLSDDIGGSGILISGTNVEEVCNSLSDYIMDYFDQYYSEEDESIENDSLSG